LTVPDAAAKLSAWTRRSGMGSSTFRTVALVTSALCVACVLPAAASAQPRVAALERALRADGFYAGRAGAPGTVASARSPRKWLPLAHRTLRRGSHGWDVAELQLALAWHGFPSGPIDGRFGPRLRKALIRFQRAVSLRADGVAGAATFASLRRAPPTSPIPIVWPLLAPLGDRFGPRGQGFHAGLDLLASKGTKVIAAAPGRVSWAGPRDGWGLLVAVAHGHDVRTMYAHLSRIDVKLGQWVAGGTVLGRVGATGNATGPHFHFEVRVGGAAIDPLRALVPLQDGV
jgi:murein DD-endopeptidase MepM/ murein hydrolase activator NlpD